METVKLDEVINVEEPSYLHPLYEQHLLMIKIQSVLDDFRELMAKLEQLKKKLNMG